MIANIYFGSVLVMCFFFSRYYDAIKKRFATNRESVVGLEFTAFVMTFVPVINTLAFFFLFMAGVKFAILKRNKKK